MDYELLAEVKRKFFKNSGKMRARISVRRDVFGAKAEISLGCIPEQMSRGSFVVRVINGSIQFEGVSNLMPACHVLFSTVMMG